MPVAICTECALFSRRQDKSFKNTAVFLKLNVKAAREVQNFTCDKKYVIVSFSVSRIVIMQCVNRDLVLITNGKT